MEVCPPTFFAGKLTKLACHNICKKTNGPICIEYLLRLGVNYCEIMTKLRKKTMDDLMCKLRNNLRWKYITKDEKNDDDSYNPELHINSHTNPSVTSEEI